MDQLKTLLLECEERLSDLESQKQNPITLGRINELQMVIVRIQQMIIKEL